MKSLPLLHQAALLSGASVWATREYPQYGVKPLVLSDGPHGLRRQLGSSDHLGIAASEPATCFPTAVTAANTWDPQLLEKMGRALGEEARILGVSVVLGPGLNIKRNPLCGRNFEYYSEDPYLAGRLAAGLIRGIQSAGVAACPKHFAVNSQETRRMASNSVVDEQTLREIYLTGFEIAVREGKAKAIMSSYNQVNGTYAHEHPHLIGQILREEWEFDGIVVSDWGGSNDPVAAVAAGSTLEMPSPGYDSVPPIMNAIKSGQLKREQVAEQAQRIIDLANEAPAVDTEAKPGVNVDPEGAHHALAEHLVEQAAVLLRNEQAVLPLAAGTRVGVVGIFADQPRIQGAGSSQVNATRIDKPLDGYRRAGLEVVDYVPAYGLDGTIEDGAQARVKQLAQGCDVVVAHIGLDDRTESEGLDRETISLPQNQLQVLQWLAEVDQPVVVVLTGGAIVDVSWRERVDAIVYAGLPGQGFGHGIARILTGQINPSGRLAETYLIDYADHPTSAQYPVTSRDVYYEEGMFVGYRYFTSRNVKVAYPFGYGLSYSSFSYDRLQVDEQGVSIDITNTSTVDGCDVVQLYVHHSQLNDRPVRELKGFTKVEVPAGATVTVTIGFDEFTFRVFDTAANSWVQPGGTWIVEVASSCEQVQASAELERPQMGMEVGGSALPKVAATVEAEPKTGEDINVNTAVVDLEDSPQPLVRFAVKQLVKAEAKQRSKGNLDLNLLFLKNMPLRAMAKMSGGLVTFPMVEAITDICRGRAVVGAVRTAKEFFRGRRLASSIAKELKK